MTEPHPVLRPEALVGLRDELQEGGAEPSEPELAAAPAPAAPTDALTRAKQAAKGGIRRGIAWYVDERAQQAAAEAADRVRARLAARVDDLARELGDQPDREAAVRAMAVNLELLKGELRSLQTTLDELGMAIAPATGLAGAGARMGELRDRVNTLERQARAQNAAPPTPPPAPPAAGSSAAPAPSAPRPHPDVPFDYVGFERRFRGDSETVLAVLSERYLDLLRDHQPVLDIGCGRGELLAALRDQGVEGLGVDLDVGMVEEARARGLDVHAGDAMAFLEQRPERSLGAVVSFHVLEHLQLDDLLALLELSASRLRPGGVFVAETPNPASLVVLGNSYVLDPTHVRPLHPSLLAFLCEGAGFRDVRLRFFAPAEDYHLPLVDAPDAPAWVEQVNAAFTKLNHVLFGPQEYAVVATVGEAVA